MVFFLFRRIKTIWNRINFKVRFLTIANEKLTISFLRKERTICFVVVVHYILIGLRRKKRLSVMSSATRLSTLLLHTRKLLRNWFGIFLVGLRSFVRIDGEKKTDLMQKKTYNFPLSVFDFSIYFPCVDRITTKQNAILFRRPSARIVPRKF